jgi:UDP-N-acetylglucosamine 2-epimerase (non-hydrolysing)
VAAKLGIPVAHIEAGLRSFDFSMPEEINRKLTDAVSQYLFVTEESGVVNLRAEGVPSNRIFLVGNIMIDSLLRHRKVAAQSAVLRNLQLKTDEDSCVPYALLTLHRPSNVDDPEALRGILEALESVGRELPVLFPVHPRSKERIEAFGFKRFFRDSAADVSKKGIHLLEPLGYLDFVCLMDHAKMVLTDSGGIQEETTVLGVPCLTLRENTERPATVDWGTNQLVGRSTERIVDAAFAILRGNYKKGDQPPLWDGRAAERIFQILLGTLRPEEQINLAVDSK